MDWYKKIKPLIRKEWVLLSLLLLAFLLRIVGVGYGLPLAVVNDEAPYTFAALLMIQLHTILPALHPEFQTVLYYPPYLSYILLVPFSVILGLQYLLWHGAPALFQAHVLLDLSPFFVAARLVTVLLGTASVYLVYRIAEKLFRSRVAASAAAFLLATSVLHEALSMVGRQWLPVSFVFLVVLFLLVKDTWSVRRRYLTAFAAAAAMDGKTTEVITEETLTIATNGLRKDDTVYAIMIRDATSSESGDWAVYVGWMPDIFSSGADYRSF